MYLIEDGIPIPKSRERVKYPTAQLEVGQSFLVATEDAHRARNVVYRYGRIHGWKFKTKSMNNGLRIWRIK